MSGIKKNDIVKVLAGKDKGKTGKVLRLNPSSDRAVVQGINFAKKHVRQRRQGDESGIIESESSIAVSNLAVMCKRCNTSTRIGVDVLTDGSKVRFCKKCNEVLG